jgi:hypothetical protein
MFPWHRRLAAWSPPGLVYKDRFVSSLAAPAVIERLKLVVGGNPQLSLQVVGPEFVLRYYLRRSRPGGRSSIRHWTAWVRLAPEGDATLVEVRVVDATWCVVPVVLAVAPFVARSVGVAIVAVAAGLYMLQVASIRAEGYHAAGFVRSAAYPIRR